MRKFREKKNRQRKVLFLGVGFYFLKRGACCLGLDRSQKLRNGGGNRWRGERASELLNRLILRVDSAYARGCGGEAESCLGNRNGRLREEWSGIYFEGMFWR